MAERTAHKNVLLNLSTFVEHAAVMEELTCYICMEVLREPVLCEEGHVFCKTCIHSWLAHHFRCPVSRETLYPHQLQAAPLCITRIIQKTRARCTNGESIESQCDWEGPYGSMATHDLSCHYKMVNCESCQEEMERQNLINHREQCTKVGINCQACGFHMERGDLDKHTEFMCGERVVSCPLQCEETVSRKDMIQHILVCKKNKQRCFIPGCGENVENLSEHNQEKGVDHSFLLLQAIHEGNTIHVNGSLASFTWTLEDATRESRSPTFEAGDHQWTLFMLPSNRDSRRHLGVFIGLKSGHPAIVMARLRVTYRQVTKMLEGQLFLRAGDIRGWEKVLLDEEMDQEHHASSLCIDVMIQF